MRLIVIEDADGNIVAWSPDCGAREPAPRGAGPTHTGIAPLPGQKMFSIDVPEDTVARMLTDETQLLRTYPRTELSAPEAPRK